MTLIHGLYCLSAHLLTQLPKTTNQPSKPEIIGGSAKPSQNTIPNFIILIGYKIKISVRENQIFWRNILKTTIIK
jgi:hypothetical protein